MYQRKYWLVQTLLKVTKAKVCASNEVGRSFLARARGMRMVDKRSWGRKARDSIFSCPNGAVAEGDDVGRGVEAEERYS